MQPLSTWTNIAATRLDHNTSEHFNKTIWTVAAADLRRMQAIKQVAGVCQGFRGGTTKLRNVYTTLYSITSRVGPQENPVGAGLTIEALMFRPHRSPQRPGQKMMRGSLTT
ncbi:hypothetical protein ElyMa_004056500 [Elysia marginata]|uniref:Uncharacterized protein n=1 Tax=Elysia marginata TaxID=1093978 RepID=A0AAV4G5S2_9GAST|nr:hypothetical protein ElyMa_004056500 [Elysia marginata]